MSVSREKIQMIENDQFKWINLMLVTKYYIVNFLIISVLLSCSSTQDLTSRDLSSERKEKWLGISYPPLRMRKIPHRDLTELEFSEGVIERLDVNLVTFSEYWDVREVTKGTFNWKSLDQRMEWVKRKKLDLLLRINSTGPKWACQDYPAQNSHSCVYKSERYFVRYIEAILKRYPKSIKQIQFGNEWQTQKRYVGTGEDYSRFNNILFDTVKRFAPNIKVSLGAFSIGSLQWLAACSGKIEEFSNVEYFGPDRIKQHCKKKRYIRMRDKIKYVLKHSKFDTIDIHLYDDAENWPIYHALIASRTSKPIVVSEFGGPNLFFENYSDEYQAKRLQIYLETLKSLDILEAYYFKLVEAGQAHPMHKKSTLFNRNFIEKPAFMTFWNFTNR